MCALLCCKRHTLHICASARPQAIKEGGRLPAPLLELLSVVPPQLQASAGASAGAAGAAAAAAAGALQEPIAAAAKVLRSFPVLPVISRSGDEEAAHHGSGNGNGDSGGESGAAVAAVEPPGGWPAYELTQEEERLLQAFQGSLNSAGARPLCAPAHDARRAAARAARTGQCGQGAAALLQGPALPASPLQLPRPLLLLLPPQPPRRTRGRTAAHPQGCRWCCRRLRPACW